MGKVIVDFTAIHLLLIPVVDDHILTVFGDGFRGIDLRWQTRVDGEILLHHLGWPLA